MLLFDGDEQFGDLIGHAPWAAAISSHLGQQRIEATGAVALEPVTDGLGGDPRARGAGDVVVARRLLGNARVKPFGAGLDAHEFGNHAVAKQGNGVAVIGVDVGHGAQLLGDGPD